MVMLVNIRRGAGKTVVGQVSCPLDLKRPKYDRLKFCITTVLLPRPTPLLVKTIHELIKVFRDDPARTVTKNRFHVFFVYSVVIYTGLSSRGTTA